MPRVPNRPDTVDFDVDRDDTDELRRMAQAVSSDLQWLGEYAAFVETTQGYIEGTIGSVDPEEDVPSWLAECAYLVDPQLFLDVTSNCSFTHGPVAMSRYPRQGRMTAGNDRIGIRIEISERAT